MIRKLARPMLAGIFVLGGYDTLTNPGRVVPKAEPLVGKLRGRVPGVPEDTAAVVRLNSSVQVGAGLLLGAGVLPRLSALALAGSLLPTTYAGHRYWEIEDPAERAQHRIHFLKNLAILGGLLIAAADNDDGGRCRHGRCARAQ